MWLRCWVQLLSWVDSLTLGEATFQLGPSLKLMTALVSLPRALQQLCSGHSEDYLASMSVSTMALEATERPLAFPLVK